MVFIIMDEKENVKRMLLLGYGLKVENDSEFIAKIVFKMEFYD